MCMLPHWYSLPLPMVLLLVVVVAVEIVAFLVVLTSLHRIPAWGVGASGCPRASSLGEESENALLTLGGDFEIGEPCFGQPLARLETLQNPNHERKHSTRMQHGHGCH